MFMTPFVLKRVLANVVVIVCLIGFYYPANAIPLTRPQASDCVSGSLSCFGNGGGYGNHLTGRSGNSSLSGYSRVRFDGFRPEPGLQLCTRQNTSDRSALSSLGLSGYSGPKYWHRRVAILRSDNSTVTNGVDDSFYWNSGLDFNLNTGATRPTTNPNRAPTQNDPWVGPNWLGNRYCLPLAGGAAIQNELTNKVPQISILYKGTVVPNLGDISIPAGYTGDQAMQYFDQNAERIFLRTKNLALRIAIEESSSSNGGITIQFHHVRDQIKIEVGSLQRFFEFIENGSDPETAREIWVDATSSRSPIYADFAHTGPPQVIHSGTTTTYIYDVPLVVKKKGYMALNVSANYDANVGGSASYTGLSGVSANIWMNAISVKSVGRR